MKSIKLFLPCLLLFGATQLSALPVDLTYGYDDHSGTMPDYPKAPPRIPAIDLQNNTITFEGSHVNYTLQIFNEDDDIVYSVYVPSTQTTVNLPSTLSGEYQLRLIPDGSNIYFYGYVLF